MQQSGLTIANCLSFMNAWSRESSKAPVVVYMAYTQAHIYTFAEVCIHKPTCGQAYNKPETTLWIAGPW